MKAEAQKIKESKEVIRGEQSKINISEKKLMP